VAKRFHEASFEFLSRDAEKRLEYADNFAHAALKSLFLVNGAAIISLLTLIGNRNLDFDRRGIFWAFVWFSIGISGALLSYFCAYFCQNFYMRATATNAWKAKCDALGIENPIESDKDTKVGHYWIRGAISAAVLSFLLFLTGTFVALVAIT
jgi:hypothetical protein